MTYSISDLPARIASKIRINLATGCWEWAACRNDQGYGQIWVGRSTRRAHRVVYELLVGPIPGGLTLDHRCRITHCVNPAHLEPVTHRENILRSPTAPTAVNARKTHCVNGHPFDLEHADFLPDRRRCRVCQRAAESRYAQRRRTRSSA